MFCYVCVGLYLKYIDQKYLSLIYPIGQRTSILELCIQKYASDSWVSFRKNGPRPKVDELDAKSGVASGWENKITADRAVNYVRAK